MPEIDLATISGRHQIRTDIAAPANRLYVCTTDTTNTQLSHMYGIYIYINLYLINLRKRTRSYACIQVHTLLDTHTDRRQPTHIS